MKKTQEEMIGEILAALDRPVVLIGMMGAGKTESARCWRAGWMLIFTILMMKL